tara:strand:- start:1857 stop:3086 length:1230 start_codon:yes stop_codon:yes gene_type:complete
MIDKESSKHILILTPLFDPEINRINDMVQYFLEKKYSITVMCPIPNYPQGKYYKNYGIFKKRYEKFGNLNIVRVIVWPRGNGSKVNIFLNYLSFIFFSIIPAIRLSFKKIDIIFVNQLSPITIAIPGIIIKKIKKIPLVMWVTDLWPESVKEGGNLKSNFLPNLILPVVRSIYNNCDQILTSSRGFINSIKEKTINHNLLYLPQWGEELFTKKSNEIYTNHDMEKIKDCKIVFAGNIGIAQDFECIVYAMNEIRNHNIHLVVLGDGRERKNVEKMVHDMNLSHKISFLGAFPLNKMPYFFNKADALLISLKKSDIFSITIPAKTQAYLAFGKPILTNSEGEVSNIINESKSGLTSDSGNYMLLAKNMLKLSLLSDNEKKVMSDNAKKYYRENFQRENILKKLEDILLSH